jgi:hypothetical protein
MNTAFDEQKWLNEELEQFLIARDSNTVVKELFVPDSTLEDFRKFHLTWDDKAYHRAVSFIARKNGVLDDLCERIVFDQKGGPEKLTKQYRKDLIETWYNSDDFNRRQSRCNKFMGKVLEFHAAEFLQSFYGWRLVDMEAFASGTNIPDVSLESSSNDQIAVSCKTLCQSPEVFDLNIQAGSNNGVSVGWLSIYSPVDYLLYRICEGIWSLERFNGNRRVVVVPLLHEANFKLQLNDNWLDFSDPQFLNRDAQLDNFWATRQNERAKAQQTLDKIADHIDGIVICSIGNNYEFSVCKEHWYREI